MTNGTMGTTQGGEEKPSQGSRHTGTDTLLALLLIWPFPDGTNLVLRADYGYQRPGNTCTGFWVLMAARQVPCRHRWQGPNAVVTLME